MRISIFTFLAVALSGLMASCIQPYPPNYDPLLEKPVEKPVEPKKDELITGDAQRQLDEIRNGMDVPSTPSPSYDPLPEPSLPTPPTPTKPSYKYATKVPGKPGFVFNPWTKNQVDVRGIPSGTLVRDPYDDDSTHKFRVP